MYTWCTVKRRNGGIYVTYIDADPVAEVRRNRELLLEKYGGIDGLL